MDYKNNTNRNKMLNVLQYFYNPNMFYTLKINGDDMYVDNYLLHPVTIVVKKDDGTTPNICSINKLITEFNLSKGFYVLPTGVFSDIDSVKVEKFSLPENAELDNLVRKIFHTDVDKTQSDLFQSINKCFNIKLINSNEVQKTRFLNAFDNIRKLSKLKTKAPAQSGLFSGILNTENCPNNEELTDYIKRRRMDNNTKFCNETTPMQCDNRKCQTPSTSFSNPNVFSTALNEVSYFDKDNDLLLPQTDDETITFSEE